MREIFEEIMDQADRAIENDQDALVIDLDGVGGEDFMRAAIPYAVGYVSVSEYGMTDASYVDKTMRFERLARE